MKKVLAVVMAAIMVLAFGAVALAAQVGTRDLIVDGGDTRTNIGSISVDYTAGDITVDYTIDDPLSWGIVETHVYVGTVAPAKHSPGKFLNEAGDAVPVTVVAGTMVYIAFHAEVAVLDGAGNPVLDEITDEPIMESAWAQWETVTPAEDTLFKSLGKNKGNKWATFFTVIPIPAP
jgi:hypothetical protein